MLTFIFPGLDYDSLFSFGGWGVVSEGWEGGFSKWYLKMRKSTPKHRPICQLLQPCKSRCDLHSSALDGHGLLGKSLGGVSLVSDLFFNNWEHFGGHHVQFMSSPLGGAFHMTFSRAKCVCSCAFSREGKCLGWGAAACNDRVGLWVLG